MNINRIGIIKNLDASEYHAAPDEVSNTMLAAMSKSAAHCWALHLDPDRPPQESTRAQSVGTLTHSAILEPASMGHRYVCKPADVDYRTKAGKEWRDSQTADIVTAEDLSAAWSMQSAFMRVTALANLMQTGDAESSVFWQDQATGLRCRARPDWLHWHGPKRATVLDVKTISDITPESVARAMATWGYHRQAAHYSNGLRAVGIEVEEFVFGFVSSSYPYIAAAFVLDDETMEQGRDEVAELLERFAQCKRTDTWPAFGDGYQATSLPTWAKRSSEIEVSYV